MLGRRRSIGVRYRRMKVNAALGAFDDVRAAAVARIRQLLIGQHLALFELAQPRQNRDVRQHVRRVQTLTAEVQAVGLANSRVTWTNTRFARSLPIIMTRKLCSVFWHTCAVPDSMPRA